MRKRLLNFIFGGVMFFLLTGCFDGENQVGVGREKNIKEGLAPVNESQIGLPSESEVESLLDSYKGAIIKTNLGEMEVSFYSDEAPLTVANFIKLSKAGFYDQVRFHRVIKDFMIQGGDPKSKDENRNDIGTGGPGYLFKDEINNKKLIRGSLAMANSGPNTNGSQFFIVTAQATPWLDGKHTNFGEVVAGLEVMNEIESVETETGDYPVSRVLIEKIKLIEK